MDLHQIKQLKEKINQLELNKSWRFKEEFDCCGITLAQCQVLLELAKEDEICMCKLADFIGVDSSTLSRTTNRMVEAGMINRITNCSDRRYVSLSLTEKGKALYHYIEERDTSYYTRVFELIPEEKRNQIIESFDLFIEALKAYKNTIDDKV